MTRTSRFFSLLAVPAIVLLAIASTAYGHARLMNPAPRDNQDGYKDPPRAPPGTGAPCGITEAASQPHTTLTPGASLNVTWEETVDHPGCFVIDFAEANDANFQILGRKSHANPPAPSGNPATRKYSQMVTLPTTPCPKCTLRLRQLMLTSNVSEANLQTGCPPATIPSGATYYSCANIVLGGGGASGTGGAGGTTGAGGGTGGGTAAGGRGGNTSSGRGGTSVTIGAGGQAGSGSGAAGTTGQAGTSGQAGDNGQAGTSGQAGNGASGQAGTTGTGQGGSSASGQAGTTGQAGNGTPGAAGSTGSGQAGTSGTGGGDDGATGGCSVAGGVPAPLVLFLGLVLFRRSRRRSRS
jgi:hypothetical protein